MGNYNNRGGGDNITPGGCLLVLIGVPVFWLLPPMLFGEFYEDHFILSYLIIWGPLVGFLLLHENPPKSREMTEEERQRAAEREAEWKAERKLARAKERQEEWEIQKAWLRSLPSKIRAKHIAAALAVLAAVTVIVVNMPSGEDRRRAADLDEKIQHFFNESKINDREIEEIEAKYARMTDRQKKLVRRYDILQEVEEFLESPTGRVKRSDLNGLWQTTAPDSLGFTYYYLIDARAFSGATRGNVPSRTELAVPEYLAAKKVTLEHFDLEKKALRGEMYCVDREWPTKFYVTVEEDGELTMAFEKRGGEMETYVKVKE